MTMGDPSVSKSAKQFGSRKSGDAEGGCSARKMKKHSIGAFCAFVSLFHIACTHISTRSHLNTSDTTLSKGQALEIAKKYIAENEDWGTQAAFGVPKRRSDSNNWSVAAWKRPLAPDSHNVIEINPAGEVVSYGPVYPRPNAN